MLFVFKKNVKKLDFGDNLFFRRCQRRRRSASHRDSGKPPVDAKKERKKETANWPKNSNSFFSTKHDLILGIFFECIDVIV